MMVFIIDGVLYQEVYQDTFMVYDGSAHYASGWFVLTALHEALREGKEVKVSYL
jgi:hypothetical protein